MTLALLWHQSPYNDSFVVIPVFSMILNALVAGLTAGFVTQASDDAEYASSMIDMGLRMIGLVSNASISIVTLTFSLTVLSVQVAAQSYSPRLLDDFVRDPVSKIVISTNLGSYAYCFVLNGFLNDHTASSRIPIVSIYLLSLQIAIVLLTFVMFIHVFINGFRIEKILSRASKSSLNAARTLNATTYWRRTTSDNESYQREGGESLRLVADEFPTVPPYAYKVFADVSGYVTSLKFGLLLPMAKDLDVVVKYNHQIGEFVVAGSVLCYVWDGNTVKPTSEGEDGTLPPKLLTLEERVEEKLTSSILPSSESDLFEEDENEVERKLGEFAMRGIVLSKKRDAEVDATLGVQQITDIAVRALSPGVNDPHSAIQCMDALASLMVKLGTMDLDVPCAYDDEGNLRLFAPRRSFSYLASMLDPIRFYGQGDVSVCRRGMRMFGELAAIMTRRRRKRTASVGGEGGGSSGADPSSSEEDRIVPALMTQMEQWMVAGKKNFEEGSPERQSLQDLYDHLTEMIATSKRKRKGKTNCEERDLQDFEITHKDESCRENSDTD